MWRPVLSDHVAAMRIQNMWRNFMGRRGLRQLVRQVLVPVCVGVKACPTNYEERKLQFQHHRHVSPKMVMVRKGIIARTFTKNDMARAKPSLLPEVSRIRLFRSNSSPLCGRPRLFAPGCLVLAVVGSGRHRVRHVHGMFRKRCMPWNTIPSPGRGATATFRPEKSPSRSP